MKMMNSLPNSRPDAICAAVERIERHKTIGKGGLFPGYLDPHGHILTLAGVHDLERLMDMDQTRADLEVARHLGTSITHAVLLRQVNDSDHPRAADVLDKPEVLLGDNAAALINFWRLLDGMAAEDWRAVMATSEGRSPPFRARRAWATLSNRAAHLVLNAWETRAAREARNERTGSTAWNGRHIAYAAMAEIAGATWLPAHAKDQHVFLPMFDTIEQTRLAA